MSTVLRHVATDATDISTENDMSHHVMHAVRIRSEMELSNMPGNTTRVTLRVDKVSTGFFFRPMSHLCRCTISIYNCVSVFFDLFDSTPYLSSDDCVKPNPARDLFRCNIEPATPPGSAR